MSNSRIREAVENAELLVDFASRNGIILEPPLIQQITKTRSLLDENKLDDSTESAFFEAYGQLSKAMGKVTVASIRDSREEFGEQMPKYVWFGPKIRISKAHLAVKRLRRQSIVALFALLCLQIYWVWGTALIDGLREIETKSAELTALDAKGKAPSEKESDTERELRTAAEDARSDEEGNLDVKFVTLDRLLRGWSSLWGLLGRDEIQDPFKDMSAFYRMHYELRVPAENRLKILQVYFLPLLYGWVGACAYVLRQLILETRDRTYQSEAKTAYDLRIFLGVLAGLAVGWFLRPDSQNKLLGQIAPFTLSFLAGYSVEVLFSAMDKLVNAFGSSSQNSKS
jgi:hypothetical protein